MAELAPLRGLYYNPDKVPNLREVVTPPYDVIKPAQQEAFYARHPYNVVRLILPQGQVEGDGLDNRYIRAAADFAAWQQQGVLIRDAVPALYFWETIFDYEGEPRTRRALVGLLRLEPFEAGVVRPHEKTFSAAKNDRFQLMTRCQAHFSNIFALYPDKTDQVLGSLRQGLSAGPLFDFEDLDGFRQRLFRVTDAGVIRSTAQAMADLPIYIADGHHRYETSLAFQARLKQQYPQASPRSAINYVFMYLSNMYDPELVIRPAHRLLNTRRLHSFKEEALLQGLPEFFEVEALSLTGGDLLNQSLPVAAALAAAGESGPTLGVATSGGKVYLLRLKPGVMTGPLAAQIPPPLANLDVIALNYLIFEKVLHLTAQEQDDAETFKYSSTVTGAMEAITTGGMDVAFLLNPTRIEQVQEVAAAGLIMPRKSTYFYPKVPVGLVLHPIDPQEEVGL